MDKQSRNQGYKDLIVFEKSYNLCLKIFEVTKSYPKEEKYSLTDQIRRSSRSIPANIAESWAKRGYPKHFTSKLSDALAEANETEVWLEMSKDLKYLNDNNYSKLINGNNEIKKMLWSMMNNSDKFCY